MRKGSWLVALLLPAMLCMPVRASEPAPAFSDLTGHWAESLIAQAVVDGYVKGYPDGTVRPDQAVTRAESVKLLMTAGHEMAWNGGQPAWCEDLPAEHWLVRQGYYATGWFSGVIKLEGEEAGHPVFRPDEPATRLEYLKMALALLGMEPREPDGALLFTDTIPDADHRWVALAVKLGLVHGFPDGTFRPDGSVTRAEAIAIAARTVQVMIDGTQAQLHLVVNGTAVPDAVLAVRDGMVYAPGNAVYTDPKRGDWRQTYGRLVNATAADTRLVYLDPALTIFGNTARPFVFDGAPVKLPGTPYVRLGELMIPVAAVGGSGSLPYAEAAHDAATGTVSVKYTPQWPGYRIPQPADVHVRGRFSVTLTPESAYTPLLTGLEDTAGRLLEERTRSPITFSVAPDSPLRLRTADGETTTTYTAGPDNNWTLPAVAVLPDPTEGLYRVHVQVGDYAPDDLEVTVVDTGVRRFLMEPSGVWKAGQAATLELTALDRFDRLSDTSTGFLGHYPDWVDRPLTPTVAITAPNGDQIKAEPRLVEVGTSQYDILHRGKAQFSFTPPVAGSYHVAVTYKDQVFEATFEVVE